MTIRMDEGAAELLDNPHRAGYAAYVVGGCVRDSLLGLTPHDWDLCTSALPQQGMELFGAEKCIPTGLQHGTVTVKQGGGLYEITTFRTEGTYTDGRHPDEVHFVPDVREDLLSLSLNLGQRPRSKALKAPRSSCLRPIFSSLPLQCSFAPVPVHRRTGGDDRHILHLSRHKIRKTGRKSLSAEEVSGFHSHL